MNAFDPTHPRRHDDDRKFRRGMYLLPSLFTVANIFCGYACIVYAMHGQLEIAATFIGVAFIVDSLDGSVARLTGTSSAFGVQLDSLADVISFGLAPAILAFAWGLSELGRKGLAAGFLFVAAAAMRLARFNIQTTAQLDKRYFVGMPSPAAAGVIAATVYAWPNALTPRPVGGDGWWQFTHISIQVLALAVVLVPAALMVTTIRFRSFKTINFGWGRSYLPLFLFIVLVASIVAKPEVTLLVLAYGYLASAFLGMAWTRMRRSKPSA